MRSSRRLSTAPAARPTVVDPHRHVVEAVAGGDAPHEVAEQRPARGCNSVTPASRREISRRSSTIWSNRRTWLMTTSSACCDRVGQVVAPGVEHLDRGRQRGERRAQLVADVGGEARLALDAALHGVGHVVERA